VRGHTPIGYGRTPGEAYGNWAWSIVIERLAEGLGPPALPIGGAEYRKVGYDADDKRIRKPVHVYCGRHKPRPQRDQLLRLVKLAQS